MFIRKFEDEGIPRKKRCTAECKRETHEISKVKLFHVSSNTSNHPRTGNRNPIMLKTELETMMLVNKV